jgi:hypothetical protein
MTRGFEEVEEVDSAAWNLCSSYDSQAQTEGKEKKLAWGVTGPNFSGTHTGDSKNDLDRENTI